MSREDEEVHVLRVVEAPCVDVLRLLCAPVAVRWPTLVRRATCGRLRQNRGDDPRRRARFLAGDAVRQRPCRPRRSPL